MGGTSSKPKHTNNSKASSSPALSIPLAKQEEYKVAIKTKMLTVLQGPFEPAMPVCIPSAVEDIIHSYWNFDCLELEKIRHPIILHHSFFRPSSLAVLAAHYVLWGHLDEVMAIVKMDRSVLKPIIEARDPMGRRVRGTLLQIALAAGSVNPFEMSEREEPHGIAEHLARHLTKEEVKAQLEVQFPFNWEEKTTERMQLYVKAAITFGEKIIRTRVPAGSTLLVECQPIIDQYRISLASNLNEVVTSGLVLDPKIFFQMRRWFTQNLARFNGWNNDKMDLFWIVGYGSLLRLASADDAHIIRYGIKNVIKLHQRPDRSLILADGSFYYTADASSGLGSSFFIDDLSFKREGHKSIFRPSPWMFVEDIMLSKHISVAKFLERVNNPPKSEEIISARA